MRKVFFLLSFIIIQVNYSHSQLLNNVQTLDGKEVTAKSWNEPCVLVVTANYCEECVTYLLKTKKIDHVVIFAKSSEIPRLAEQIVKLDFQIELFEINDLPPLSSSETGPFLILKNSSVFTSQQLQDDTHGYTIRKKVFFHRIIKPLIG